METAREWKGMRMEEEKGDGKREGVGEWKWGEFASLELGGIDAPG